MLSADIRQEIPIIRQVTGSAAASQPSPDRAGMARPGREFIAQDSRPAPILTLSGLQRSRPSFVFTFPHDHCLRHPSSSSYFPSCLTSCETSLQE